MPAVLGVTFGGLAALWLAATHPERVLALVLVNGYACLTRRDDYLFGVPASVVERFRESLVEPGLGSGDDVPLMAPSMMSDASFAAWWRRAGHRGASPATARAVWRASETDLRPILAGLRVPTLVLHARDNRFCRVDNGRYLAEHVAGARYVELDTADHVPWASTADFTGEIEEFLTGTRHIAPSDRFLATVLFSDIVGSTEQVTTVGDRAWTARLEQHDRAIDRQLGRSADTWSSERAMECSLSSTGRPGLCSVRLRFEMLSVNWALMSALVCTQEKSNDVVTTWRASPYISLNTFRPRPSPEKFLRPGPSSISSSGSDLRNSRDRGEHELKGLQGKWRLFVVGARSLALVPQSPE